MWSKLQEGDAASQLRINASDGAGLLGAHECFGDATSPQVKVNEWCAISASVDTSAVSVLARAT